MHYRSGQPNHLAIYVLWTKDMFCFDLIVYLIMTNLLYVYANDDQLTKPSIKFVPIGPYMKCNCKFPSFCIEMKPKEEEKKVSPTT